MIQEYRNVLGNFKEDYNKMRFMIIQEYRNLIGKLNILVISTKATTKWILW